MVEYVWKLPDGKIVGEKQLKDGIRSVLTERMFVDVLDNSYPEVVIAGKSYDAGRTLAAVDPGRFERLYKQAVDEYYDDRNQGSLGILGIDRMRADPSYSRRSGRKG